MPTLAPVRAPEALPTLAPLARPPQQCNTSSRLPVAIAYGAGGALLIGCLGSVRRVSGGVIATVAGTGIQGYGGDGGPGDAAGCLQAQSNQSTQLHRLDWLHRVAQCERLHWPNQCSQLYWFKQSNRPKRLNQ
eukprot:gene15673-biopygen1153